MIRSPGPKKLWDRLSAVAKIPAALVCAIAFAGGHALAQEGPSRSVKTLARRRDQADRHLECRDTRR